MMEVMAWSNEEAKRLAVAPEGGANRTWFLSGKAGFWGGNYKKIKCNC